MAQLITVEVDLAKSVIQVSVATPAGKELTNKKSLTRKKFGEFLATRKASLMAFEACASAHHWARMAQAHGHDVWLLPALSVSPFRQGHKTDQNDALAVAEAPGRPNLKEAPLKSLDPQALQAIQRSREMLIRDRTAISNHIRGLLLEFGIAIPKGFSHLHRQVPEILEDAENGVPHSFRSTLHLMHRRLLEIKQDIDVLTEQIEELVKANEPCRRLLDIEGVGPISAVLLYATLGSGEAFSSEREFSSSRTCLPNREASTYYLVISKKLCATLSTRPAS